jgi:putative addiction module component (TIGR02574 family)
MSPSSQELLNAALKLSEDERIVLAGELLESVGPAVGDAQWIERWQSEVIRRWQELESGQVHAVPWTEVERRLQQLIDRPGHA